MGTKSQNLREQFQEATRQLLWQRLVLNYDMLKTAGGKKEKANFDEQRKWIQDLKELRVLFEGREREFFWQLFGDLTMDEQTWIRVRGELECLIAQIQDQLVKNPTQKTFEVEGPWKREAEELFKKYYKEMVGKCKKEVEEVLQGFQGIEKATRKQVANLYMCANLWTVLTPEVVQEIKGIAKMILKSDMKVEGVRHQIVELLWAVYDLEEEEEA